MHAVIATILDWLGIVLGVVAVYLAACAVVVVVVRGVAVSNGRR